MAREDDQSRATSSFLEWMNLQEQDLAELLEARSINQNPVPFVAELIHKSLTHFEDYMNRRAQLARKDVSAFFAPTWHSSLENSLIWIAGCRPTIFFRLLYALCGAEVNAHLEEFLQGDRKTDNLGDLSRNQMRLVDELQRRTIKEEEMLDNKLASLQEEIADDPMSLALRQVCTGDDRAERAFEQHDKTMVSLLEEADKLRLNTLRELVGILTPFQAVDFMAASKKLHLCIHELGKRRDSLHGRRN